MLRAGKCAHARLGRPHGEIPILLAIDDFHRIDEPSAALMALLERDSTQHGVCLLISAESDATWTAESAHKTLQAAVTRIRLASLTAEDSEKLLRSLFGGAPNVNLLAHRFQDLCAGNPRDLLRLAQHVIDRGFVRYAAAAWTLPAQLDDKDLPVSMAAALITKLSQLSVVARDLACAFALCPDQSFSFSECSALAGVLDNSALIASIEELTAADVARRVGDNIRLSQRAWTPLLRAGLPRVRELLLEQRLASLFERRVGQEFRAAQHAFRCGEADRALDLLVAHAQTSKERTHRARQIYGELLDRITQPDRAGLDVSHAVYVTSVRRSRGKNYFPGCSSISLSNWNGGTPLRRLALVTRHSKRRHGRMRRATVSGRCFSVTPTEVFSS
jgi:hypothetical protein